MMGIEPYDNLTTAIEWFRLAVNSPSTDAEDLSLILANKSVARILLAEYGMDPEHNLRRAIELGGETEPPTPRRGSPSATA